ncbi:MAG: transporter substrate-binding domain-containing protein [Betaproteobacteria bacterium]|nr:transporter substrate-binding domain-containing protein [Betaproteobacteria bacterium]
MRVLLILCLLIGSAFAFAAEDADKILVVGSELNYPPFALGMTDEEAGGFTVDLWKAVAAESGIKFAIRVRPFRQILQEFKEGKIDILINLARSEERRQFADFTVPHVVVNGAIFVRRGEFGIQSESDLANKSIIVLNADLGHDYAVSQGWQKQLVLVDTANDGFKLLASGKHDAMLLSKIAGMQTLEELKFTNVYPLAAKAGFSQKFSFAVRKGESDLLARINEGMALTKSNGTYDALYEKWFGVYADKELTHKDLLKIMVIWILLFLGTLGFMYFRRQVERNLASSKLAESEKLLKTVIDTSPLRIFWKDKESQYLGCNPVFAKDAGAADPKEVIGKDDFQLRWGAQAETYRAIDKEILSSGIAKLSYEESMQSPDGRQVWLSMSKVPLRHTNGEIFGLLGIYDDITERKLAQDAIHNLAFYDALTQLANRSLLSDRLNHAISVSRRSGCYGAVLYLDLDKFKPLNDLHGHKAGDLLLIEVALRLSSCVREVDTVARVGGDEFVVILTELDKDKAKAAALAGNIAEKIRTTLAEPYVLPFHPQSGAKGTIQHLCSSSIGVALFVGHGAGQEEILKAADQAMYQAKKEGGNRFSFDQADAP